MQSVRRTNQATQQRRSARDARGLQKLLALLLLVPTLVLVTTTSAGAAVVAGFEIDGNMPDDPAVVGVDWSTPVGTHATDPVGNADTTTFKGSKEFEHPSTWVRGTGLAPNQDDVSDVYSYSQVVGTDTWSFIGFRRFTTSGTTNYDVEYNQVKNSTTTPFAPIRTPGDLMVRFEQDGNSTFKLTLAYKWTRITDPAWGAGCIEVPAYTPRSGWCSVPVAGSGFVGATGEDGHFAEGAFNLSSFFGTTTCRGAFGTLNLRSFTGNSDQSSLKDYINPLDINIPSNCGQLQIRKFDQFGNDAAGATFTVSPNPIPGQVGTLTVVDGGLNDVPQAADGSITINPATPGTYTVTETAPPPGAFLPLPQPNPSVQVAVGPSGVGSTGPATFVDQRTFEPPTIVNAPTYDVDYNWQVSKSVVGPGAINVPEGTNATFGYEVRLKALDQVPADFSDFDGTVTLTNPNALDMVVTLSTVITGGAACTVDGAAGLDVSDDPGLQVNLDQGANVFTYSCPHASLPGGTTATAAWDEAVYPQTPAQPAPTYERSHAAPFTIDQKTDETTTVTDIFNKDAGTTKTWGPFNWNTVRTSNVPAAHTIVVDTYSRDVAGTPGTCTDYPNTARESADQTTDSETVTVCVGKNLDVTKTANLGYERELLWGISKSGPGTVFTGADAQGNLRRMVRYTIDITADGVTDSAWALTGIISLDNPNAWSVTGTITDTVVVDGRTLSCVIDEGADARPAVPGQQVTVLGGAVDQAVPYRCPGVTQGDYVGKNTVTFDYSADSHEYPDADDTDSHEQTVSITGDPTPTNATVTISDLLNDTDVTAALPQTSFEWSTVHAMTAHTQRINYDVLLGTTEDACTPYKNVVTIDQTKQSDDHTVTVCSPGLAKSVVADYGRKQPWSLTKNVDKTFVEVGPGGEATFNYTVTATPGQVVPDGSSSWTGVVSVHNPSATESLTVSLTDTPSVPGWTGCAFTGQSTGIVLAAGASKEVPYTCTGTGFASGTNEAKATFADQQSVTETVDVTFVPRSGVTDSTTTLTDDIPDDGLPAKVFAVDAAKGANVFTYARTLGAPAGNCETYTNTAVLALTGDDLSADRTVRVCEEAPLEAEVSGSADLARTYTWSIAKVADATQRTVDASNTATFTYTVTATAGAATDSGWQLTGSVKLVNPNQYAEGDIAADVTAATNLGGGSACTVPGGEDVVIPASDDGVGSVTLPITCTFTSRPSGSGALDVTVTWDPAGEATTASVTDSAPITFTVRSETNETVQVVDDKTVPGQRVVLDPALTWAPGLVKTYTYALAVAGGVAGACQSHTNVATIDLPVGTDPTASAVVSACTPAAEVLPEQAFGKAVGSVKASCQGTVRVKMSNRSGEKVTYTLRVGKKVHKIAVSSFADKKFVTHGRALARVTLAVGSTRLDKLRIPSLCEAPQVLPDTGLRATSSS